MFERFQNRHGAPSSSTPRGKRTGCHTITSAPSTSCSGCSVNKAASWFEEFLGGQVIDETGLRGLYGFELTRTVGTRDELIDVLRDQAGVSITREPRDTPALVVRRR